MLKNVSVTNFKSWRSVPTMRLAPITGLFGTNSSGKSSLLQLLLLLKQTVESSDRALTLEFGDQASLANLGAFPDAIHSHDTGLSLEFSLNWALPETIELPDPDHASETLFSAAALNFSASIYKGKATRLHTKHLMYKFGDLVVSMGQKAGTVSKYKLSAHEGSFRLVRNPGRPWDLPPPVKFYGFPDQAYAYYKNAGFLATLQLELEKLFRSTFYLGPLREFPQRHYRWKGSEPADMGQRGEKVVDAILASRTKGAYISPGFRKKRQTLEERVAYWLKELGLIENFRVNTLSEKSNLYEVSVRRNRQSPDVLITDVGFGVSQLLPIIVLCYYVPEGSTLLFEQPEIHLHPSVQSGLADIFLDAVKNRKIQVIFESHSEHLLKRLQRRVAEKALEPSNAALYFCNMKESETCLSELELDLYGRVSNWPSDFFGNPFEEVAATREAMLTRQSLDD